MPHREDEFYIGYSDETPAGYTRLVRRVCLGLALLVVLLVATIWLGQHRFAASVFEFGHERTFTGTIVATPYPTLLVSRPGTTGELPAVSRYLLVGVGKRGAAETVAGFEGRHVELRGVLIYRDGESAIEVIPGTVVEAPAASASMPSARNLGRLTLAGEIVDSKCYLGVMNPGNAKPHRACAVRCISGGSPPLFIVREADGRTTRLLLADADGLPVGDRVLDFVAEPIEVTGTVVQEGDALVFRADPSTYRRITE